MALTTLQTALDNVTGKKLEKPRRRRRVRGAHISWELDDPFEAKAFLEHNLPTLEFIADPNTNEAILRTFVEGTDAHEEASQVLRDVAKREAQIRELLVVIPGHSDDLAAAYARCMNLLTADFGGIGEAEVRLISDTLNTLSDDNSVEALSLPDHLSYVGEGGGGGGGQPTTTEHCKLDARPPPSSS